MKYRLSVMLTVLLFLLGYSGINAQVNTDVIKLLGDKARLSEFLLRNTHLGNEFWVTFFPIWGLYDHESRIFVVALKKTTVTVEPAGGGNKITRTIEANNYLLLSTKTGEIYVNWLGTESEYATNNGYHISSTEPVAVFVYSSNKDYAGEGYQALPVSAWGSEYYDFSYYDYYYQGNGMNHPGGFIIIASEDNTGIKIELKGKGYGYATTRGGKKIGETISASINAGQTYMVTGNNKTSGLFDLTGTRITSTKPVAVVSFHEFACITSFCSNFGNYFCEMLLPVHAWGTKYVTLQFTRNGDKKNMGDYYRVIASQDNTSWKVKYYDRMSNQMLGQQSMTMKKAGDFFEYFQDNCSGQTVSIPGVSVWEADKPIMVMQYSYSWQWDNDQNWSPLMIQANPLCQYTDRIIFLSPPDFPSEMSVFAEGDTSDKQSAKLKSIKLDGENFSTKYGQILFNKVPNTNIFWGKYDVSVGVHTLEADAKMAGYISHPRPSCVGWFIGMTTNKIDELDTLPPNLNISGSCGNYTVIATDNTKGTPPSNQIDQGLSRIMLIDELSNNFTLTLENPEDFKPQLKMAKQKFFVNVIDNTKPGKALFAVIDRAGNISLDSLEYQPDSLQIASNCLDFKTVRAKTQKDTILNIVNKSNNPVEIDCIKFIKGLFTKCLPDSVFSLQPDDSLSLKIKYTPLTEQTNFGDVDTLKILTKCNEFNVLVKGKGVMPHIQATDFDFGVVDTNKTECIENKNGFGLRIDNVGTDYLTVMELKNIQPPFSISDTIEPALPFVISPGDFANVKSICFSPLDSGLFSSDLTIVSDADSTSKNIKLTGIGKIKPTYVAEGKTGINSELFDLSVTGGNVITTEFYLIHGTGIKIELYDMAGRLVSLFLNKFLESGNYHFEFSDKKIPDGIYLLTITNNRVLATKLLILAK